MFEGYTFKTVLERMLSRLPPTLDRREGSFLYAALAPTAWELAEAYANLDRAMNDGFAATATRESLILLGRERGIAPHGATASVVEVKFSPETVEIPIGTACVIDGVPFTVTSQKEANIYRLTCDVLGEEGNVSGSDILVTSPPEGFLGATFLRVSAAGLSEEETEAFRARYFETLAAQAFGGNRADYTARIGALPGVGSVKILPSWNGEGTVKAIITAEDGTAPNETRVSEIQAQVNSFAPIGHTVTVAPASLAVLDVSATLTYDEGADTDAVLTRVMDTLVDRFDLLAQTWSREEICTVRIAKIYAWMLNCDGVAGVTNLTVGGESEDITLSPEELPVLGDLLLA